MQQYCMSIISHEGFRESEDKNDCFVILMEEGIFGPLLSVELKK